MVTPLEALEVERVGDDRFAAANALDDTGRPVFGGQLLGQMVMVGSEVDPAKFVRSVSVVFPRTGDPSEPLRFDVETVHAGRTMSTLGVHVTQNEGSRIICRGTVLLDSDDKDVMRHGAMLPDEAGKPSDWDVDAEQSSEGAEVRVVGDAAADALHGKAMMLAWVRWHEAPRADRARNHAISSWFTDSQLVGAAMRPHANVTMEMAHVSVSTGVLSHSMSFHEESDAAEWHLLVNDSTFAGGGRIYGSGALICEDGRHIASFAQDGMVRWFPESGSRAGGVVM